MFSQQLKRPFDGAHQYRYWRRSEELENGVERDQVCADALNTHPAKVQ